MSLPDHDKLIIELRRAAWPEGYVIEIRKPMFDDWTVICDNEQPDGSAHALAWLTEESCDHAMRSIAEQFKRVKK